MSIINIFFFYLLLKLNNHNLLQDKINTFKQSNLEKKSSVLYPS